MLRRTTPLRAKTPLGRSAPLRKVSLKRLAAMAAGLVKRKAPAPAVPKDVRAIIVSRSGGWCEIALDHGCLGRATDPAHRVARKAGGRKRDGKALVDRPSAVLYACRVCHSWSEAAPADSYEMGLKLREGRDPTEEPVVYRGRLVYLDDEGGVCDFEECGP